MPRGGARSGAGAKSVWNNSKTQTIRVPIALANQLLQIGHILDQGETIVCRKNREVYFVNYQGNSQLSPETIEIIANEILSDEDVTRQGQDEVPVRRAIRAFIERLLNN